VIAFLERGTNNNNNNININNNDDDDDDDDGEKNSELSRITVEWIIIMLRIR
jgi:hypothetical protein